LSITVKLFSDPVQNPWGICCLNVAARVAIRVIFFTEPARTSL
jgi:hypothetical protein